MKKKMAYLVLVVLIIFSCKKTENEPESSQLWIKVSESVPDFIISFKSENVKSTDTYVVSYTNKIFAPTLKMGTVTDNGNIETWVLVYNSYSETAEITFETADHKLLTTKGFKSGEKRCIEVMCNSGGAIAVQDIDISILNEIIWVN
jgi:hypothetical protein